MKVGEIIKITEADGWYLKRTRGSHRQYGHTTNPGKVTVPGTPSKDLPPGLQRSILRQAGLLGHGADRPGRRAAVTVSADYVIVIEKGAGNYGAWCPDLPGVVAVGDTVPACVEAMREAIAFHLEGMLADGDPVPPPAAVSATTVHVDAA